MLRVHYHFDKSTDQLFCQDTLLSLKVNGMKESLVWQFIVVVQTT
jgi:hypothetical protein